MSNGLPPDEASVLSRLKDFQRATANYAYRRLYEDNPPVHRFLIADEVGLGKTVVARGVLARAINHLWNRVDRIDIIYVCSNLAIASQNINKLKEGLGINGVPPLDRLTLLPSSIRNLKENRVNFIAFTPATSFEFQSLGAARERVLLYRLLTRIWGGGGTGAMNLLQGGVVDHNNWRSRLVESQHESLEPTIVDLFQQEMSRHPKLKSEFERLSSDFRYATNNRSPKARSDRNRLIGDLRRALATCCLRALQPDVIIFDEFQRFKELLNPATQAGELANQLIDYSDQSTRAKVLLLSATPYRTLTVGSTLDGEGHYSDFLKTIEFLDREKVPTVTRLMHDYRLAIQAITDPTSPTDRVQEIKGEIQQELRSVMARTERLAASSERMGMLRELHAEVVPEAADLRSYVGLQSVSKALGVGGALTYWKTAPYPLSFMDEYQLKKEVEKRTVDRGASGLPRLPECGWIAQSDVDAYTKVDPRNARLRELQAQTIDTGAWELLWIPPSAPYYRLEGAYGDPLLKSFTKRLIFSGWRVVPKALSVLLSYEAERSALRAVKKDARYATSSDRDGGLLRFSTTDGRDTGMPIFTLLYPCDVLADEIDPVVLGQPESGQTELASAAALVGRAERRIDSLMSELADQQRLDRVDERWYWAAPMLLDRIHRLKSSQEWWGNPQLSIDWVGGDLNAQSTDDSTSWQSHIQMARQVAVGTEPLGQMPSDLSEVLAVIALAAPATAALRALRRVAGHTFERSGRNVQVSAASVGWAFRTMFNLPDVQAVIRSSAIKLQHEVPDELDEAKEAYWRQVLNHCLIGGLPAVIDEYVHVLGDQVASHDDKIDEVAKDVAATIRLALQLRTPTLTVDQLDPDGRISKFQIRARFARALTDVKLDGKQVQTATQVRTAFNSPFWPFVLVSTSIGQEGLDFHQYCHAVVHWDLPTNPVDLEQREGRIHRYKGHAVRKNVARRNWLSLYQSAPSDPWDRLFDAARMQSAEASEMAPYWAYLDGPDGAFIERHVLSYALSRDVARLRNVKDSLVIYRLAFGQPHQQDLLDFLTATHTPESARRLADLLRVDLSPSSSPIQPVAAGASRQAVGNSAIPT